MSLVLIPMRARVSCCAQEFGNVAFVESHGFGAFSRQPTKIAQTVSTWLQDERQLLRMQAAARSAATPEVQRRTLTLTQTLTLTARSAAMREVRASRSSCPSS